MLPSGNARYACQPDTLIILHFSVNIKFIFLTQWIRRYYIPALKGFCWGVSSRFCSERFDRIL